MGCVASRSSTVWPTPSVTGVGVAERNPIRSARTV
jgi:hypothetical protein